MYIKTFGSLDSERENGKTSNVTTRAYSRGQGPRDWFFSKLPALMANLKSKKKGILIAFVYALARINKNVFWAAIRSPCSSAMVWPRQEASGPHNLKLGYKTKTAATSGLLFKKKIDSSRFSL